MRPAYYAANGGKNARFSLGRFYPRITAVDGWLRLALPPAWSRALARSSKRRHSTMPFCLPRGPLSTRPGFAPNFRQITGSAPPLHRQFTVNGVELMAEPSGVVTTMLPVTAPVGTVAVIWV